METVKQEDRMPVIEHGLDPAAFEAAMRAFHIGPPGVLCSVTRNDSAPPEYEPIPSTVNDEREDIARAIRGYLDAR